MPQPFERQALHNHFSRTGHCRQENALTSENRRANAADHLNVVIDSRIECHQMSGLNLNLFAGGEIEFDEISARMNEHAAGARQLFKNEALAAQQTSAQTSHQRDIQVNGGLGEQKSVSLNHNALAGSEVEDMDLARVVACKTDLAGQFRTEIRHH